MFTLKPTSATSMAAILCLSIPLVTAGCATGERLPDLSGATGTTATDQRLQYDITQTLWLLESIDDVDCEGWQIVHTEIIDPPKIAGQSPWTEKWSIDRCGEKVAYTIDLEPTPGQGGTDFSVKFAEKEQ